jgi:hypothetical protein
MKLVLTSHVMQRMRERVIEREHIEQALGNVLSEWATPEGSIQYLGRTADGRELKVWLVAPGLSARRVIVKSAAWKA